MRSRLIASLTLAPTLALAQTVDPGNPFTPADPRLAGPPAAYSSPFNKITDPGEVAWPAANETMRRLRGHRGHLEQSETARSDHGPADAAPDTAPPNRSDHHGKH